jgi:hypothetical protein
MDHVMLKIEQYYSIYLEDFIEEHLKHNHKTLKENPLYPEISLLIKSINLYRDYLDLPKINLSTEVKSVLKGVSDD